MYDIRMELKLLSTRKVLKLQFEPNLKHGKLEFGRTGIYSFGIEISDISNFEVTHGKFFLALFFEKEWVYLKLDQVKSTSPFICAQCGNN